MVTKHNTVFMLMLSTCKYFLTHVTHMRTVHDERYTYALLIHRLEYDSFIWLYLRALDTLSRFSAIFTR